LNFVYLLFYSYFNFKLFNSTTTIYKMFITESVPVENGSDYSFVCKKVPFAITCSQDFLNYGCNLIDLDLVNKMKLNLRNIKVCRMEILGQNMRSVGIIKQTLQCVKDGKVNGNIHLTAKVVRDLSTIFNVDCVASPNTFSRLTGRNITTLPSGDTDDQNHEILHLGGDDDDEHSPAAKVTFEQDNSGDTNDNSVSNCDSTEYEDEDDEDGISVPVLKYLRNPSGYPVYQPDPDPEPDEYQLYQEDPNFVDHDDPSKLPDGQYEVCHAHDWINCRRCHPEVHQIQPQAQSDEMCRLCHMEGLPAEVFKSHPMLHPRCPSMSDVDKKRLYGRNWRSLT